MAGVDRLVPSGALLAFRRCGLPIPWPNEAANDERPYRQRPYFHERFSSAGRSGSRAVRHSLATPDS